MGTPIAPFLEFREEGSKVLDHRERGATRHSPVFDHYEWKLQPDRSVHAVRLADKWSTFPAQDCPVSIRASAPQWGQPLRFSAVATDHLTTEDLALLQAGPDIYLAGHPTLQSGPTLLPTLKSNPRPQAAIRRVVTTIVLPVQDHLRPGLQALHDRLLAQRQRHGALGVALQSCSWPTIQHGKWGLSEYQRFFWYRLVLGSLNLRDTTGGALPCPHRICSRHDPLTITHIFWSCPVARLFWAELMSSWCGPSAAATITDADRQFAVFSRLAPRSKPKLCHVLAATLPIFSDTQQIAAKLWTAICTIAAHHLWLRRNEAAFHDLSMPATALVRSTWRAVEHQLAALFTPRRDLQHDDHQLPSFADWWEALTAQDTDTGARSSPVL